MRGKRVSDRGYILEKKDRWTGNMIEVVVVSGLPSGMSAVYGLSPTGDAVLLSDEATVDEKAVGFAGVLRVKNGTQNHCAE